MIIRAVSDAVPKRARYPNYKEIARTVKRHLQDEQAHFLYFCRSLNF